MKYLTIQNQTYFALINSAVIARAAIHIYPSTITIFKWPSEQKKMNFIYSTAAFSSNCV